jgi:hypothetical protein
LAWGAPGRSGFASKERPRGVRDSGCAPVSFVKFSAKTDVEKSKEGDDEVPRKVASSEQQKTQTFFQEEKKKRRRRRSGGSLEMANLTPLDEEPT